MVKLSRSLNSRPKNRSVEEINSILEEYKSYCEENLAGEERNSFGYIVAGNNKTALRINSFANEAHYPYKSLDNRVSVYQTMVILNYRKMKDRHLIKRKLEKEFAEEFQNTNVFFAELFTPNYDDCLIVSHCDQVNLLDSGRDKSEYIDWFNKHVINVLDILRL